MPRADTRRRRCAIYTRKSSEEGLEQEFNSLHAQREACEAYIKSQRHEGWVPLAAAYDDGGFSGGSLQRPGLQRLLQDLRAGKVDVIVTYKVDRLTRSLVDFARLIEIFDAQQVSFVSVTQQFNTTTSMGRLTLNVLLSFAQFEREVTGECIRDKIAASKRKGMWMGGNPPLGYDIQDGGQPGRGRDRKAALCPLPGAWLRAPGQGSGRPARPPYQAPHRQRCPAGWETVLPRAHLQAPVEPDLYRADRA
jgi:site-specific DNA recombinase